MDAGRRRDRGASQARGDELTCSRTSGIVPSSLTVTGWGYDGDPFRWTMCSDSFYFGSVMNPPPFVTRTVKPSSVLTLCRACRSRGLEPKE